MCSRTTQKVNTPMKSHLSSEGRARMMDRGKFISPSGRLLFCLFFVLVSPLSTRCQQSRLDVSTNYSYLRANPAGNGESFDADGGSISAAWRLRSWVGLAVDFGGYNFREQPV